MGNGDLKKSLAKLVNDKKFLNVVVIALILAFVLLAISFITTSRKKDYLNNRNFAIQCSFHQIN